MPMTTLQNATFEARLFDGTKLYQETIPNVPADRETLEKVAKDWSYRQPVQPCDELTIHTCDETIRVWP